MFTIIQGYRGEAKGRLIIDLIILNHLVYHYVPLIRFDFLLYIVNTPYIFQLPTVPLWKPQMNENFGRKSKNFTAHKKAVNFFFFAVIGVENMLYVKGLFL